MYKKSLKAEFCGRKSSRGIDYTTLTMKIVSTILPALSIAQNTENLLNITARSASQQLHSVQVRNLPKEWVVGVFVNMLQQESTNELDSLFYRTIQKKVESEGLQGVFILECNI